MINASKHSSSFTPLWSSKSASSECNTECRIQTTSMWLVCDRRVQEPTPASHIDVDMHFPAHAPRAYWIVCTLFQPAPGSGDPSDAMMTVSVSLCCQASVHIFVPHRFNLLTPPSHFGQAFSTPIPPQVCSTEGIPIFPRGLQTTTIVMAEVETHAQDGTRQAELKKPRSARKSERLQTALRSYRVLKDLTPEQVQNFMDSYEIYSLDWADEKTMVATLGSDYKQKVGQKLADYYCVLNHLCALGELLVHPSRPSKAVLTNAQRKDVHSSISLRPEYHGESIDVRGIGLQRAPPATQCASS